MIPLNKRWVFLLEMKEQGLRPNEISYSTLINRSDTFEQAMGFLLEMKEQGLRPNEISYSTLINRSDTFEQAMLFFRGNGGARLESKHIYLQYIVEKNKNSYYFTDYCTRND